MQNDRNELLKILRDNIELLRSITGIKILDFIRIIGTNRMTYHRFTKGEGGLPLEVIKNISTYFDIPTDYLMGLSDIEKPTMDLLNEISSNYKIPIDELIKLSKKLKKP